MSFMPSSPVSAATLVVGGGCFWCTEAAYETQPGVVSVESGYAGGSTPNPSYEQVCSGATGHAEVVKITYDPAKTSLAALLDFFFVIHDPTTLNRQGADTGTQYRSIILYADDSQKSAAEAAKDRAREKWGDRIVTQIVPLKAFYPAEAYHQDYYRKHPDAGYCQVVIRPKLEKIRHETGSK